MSKKKKEALSIKDSFKVLSFIFGAILMSACSQEIVFPASPVVPGAEAFLRVEQNKNENYDIDFEVISLADPTRLSPSRSNYVVWMVTKRNGTVNLGNLKVNKKNKASLKTVTPYEPIRIFVTAEDTEEAVLPSSQVVLDSEEFEV